MHKKIALTGMMGTGKTTIGKLLADNLQIPFFDSDILIEDFTKQSINYVFQHHGEKYFRSLEKSMILQIIDTNNLMVLSLGGGSFIQNKVRTTLKEKKFLTIWLKVPITTIITRLRKNKTRPLLTSTNQIRTLTRILKARERIYAQADLHLTIRDCTTHDIVKQILKEL